MNEGINCLMTKGGNSNINGAELAHLPWSWGFGLHPNKKIKRAEERLIVYVLRAMAYSVCVLYVLIEA